MPHEPAMLVPLHTTCSIFTPVLQAHAAWPATPSPPRAAAAPASRCSLTSPIAVSSLTDCWLLHGSAGGCVGGRSTAPPAHAASLTCLQGAASTSAPLARPAPTASASPFDHRSLQAPPPSPSCCIAVHPSLHSSSPAAAASLQLPTSCVSQHQHRRRCCRCALSLHSSPARPTVNRSCSERGGGAVKTAGVETGERGGGKTSSGKETAEERSMEGLEAC